MNQQNSKASVVTLRLCVTGILLAVCVVVITCSAHTHEAADPMDPVHSSENDGKDKNACHLLSHIEVSELVGERIVMSDQTEVGETWSTCSWENEDGITLFLLTVYWENGKQEWETWRLAMGFANKLFEQTEGIRTDDIIKQGPVRGIGDAAYFSETLPSLVLKGDVLFEISLALVPDAGAKFTGIARKLLSAVE
jgi:hypothetical protein